ncbi:MAG: molybdate ABC transporter permease subunit [Acidobacteriota bacterium]
MSDMGQVTVTVLLSLKVAVMAVLLNLPPALIAARLLARRRFPGRGAVETILSLPLVLPPVATGFLLLALLAPRSPLGHFLAATLGVRLVFTWLGAALAAAVVSFPLVLRSLLLGFEAVDPRLGQVARTLGAGPVSIYFRVHLPLALPAVISGSLLAFARALGEFGATVIVAGSIPGQTRTLPLDLFHRVANGDEAGALRLAAISAGLAFGTLALGRMAEHRLRIWGEK